LGTDKFFSHLGPAFAGGQFDDGFAVTRKVICDAQSLGEFEQEASGALEAGAFPAFDREQAIGNYLTSAQSEPGPILGRGFRKIPPEFLRWNRVKRCQFVQKQGDGGGRELVNLVRLFSVLVKK
jgi:hypothetical protein